MIFCSNPLAQYLAYKDDIDGAIARVLGRGHYILGEEVRAFEEAFARYVGVPYGVGTGSGTEALHLALTACGVGVGDEVVTVSHTAVATVAAIELAGAKPVLVDIEPDFYTMDPQKLSKALTPRTKAVIPVHLYGQPADMAAILEMRRRFGFRIIEDCAQAHGAFYGDKRLGSFGDMACFSFYPTKNLGALGDAGMVVTSDTRLWERALSLRQYGWSQRYVSEYAGWNTRLDELQAAVLWVKLRSLDQDNKQRVGLAEAYSEGLAGMDLILPGTRKGATHVYHQYVVRSGMRDRLIDYLEEREVRALIHYPVPIHRQPAYIGRLRTVGSLMETEKAAQEILSLPMYPELQLSQQSQVITAIKEFYASHDH